MGSMLTYFKEKCNCCKKKDKKEEGKAGKGFSLNRLKTTPVQNQRIQSRIARLRRKMKVLGMGNKEVHAFMRECGSDGTMIIRTDPKAKVIEFERS